MSDGILLNAIVLKCTPTGEADGFLQLYSAEEGRLAAGMRGVRKAKAKLKFAAQPFCFGEYVISRRGAASIVTGCTLAESFFDIASDLDKYYAACAALEVVLAVTEEGAPDGRIFVALLKTLRELCYSQADFRIILSKFFMDFLSFNGYRLSYEKCAVCGLAPRTDIFFNPRSGGVLCSVCGGGAQIPRTVYNNLRFLSESGYSELSTLRLPPDSVAAALNLLYGAVRECFNVKLNSFDNF
jgi:DNA repair protein RecO (recombination protein O)